MAASAPLTERAATAYSRTSVTAGRGTLIVTATGQATDLGRVAELMERVDPVGTPLQLRAGAA